MIAPKKHSREQAARRRRAVAIMLLFGVVLPVAIVVVWLVLH